MPVITRSCGKKAPRRRIEDPTPRACKTTAKRRKDVSDEENERPPKKKQYKLKPTPKTARNNKSSRIPRRCLTEKKSVDTRSQTSNKDDGDDDDDDDEIQFKITDEVRKTETQEPANVQCIKQQTPLYISPVAARTRSYSALKRSYERKKENREVKKPMIGLEISSISTSTFENPGEDFLQEREKEDKALHEDKEVDHSTCNAGNDDHMKSSDHMNSSDQEKNDQYYKNKYHEMVENLKQMQEQFSQAYQNTCKNITAYDTFIKELKTSLELEKRKNSTIEEELKETREQLLMTQKEIEAAKTNEQNNGSINSTCVSQEPSQSEERSQQSEVEELEKAETSSLLAMLKCYSELTGITLSMDIPPSNSELIESFHCAYRPKGPTGHVMQFCLTYDKEFEEYEYSPSFQTPKGEEFLHKIPGHLKKNICFSSDQAQSFLLSLIKAVQNKTGSSRK